MAYFFVTMISSNLSSVLFPELSVDLGSFLSCLDRSSTVRFCVFYMYAMFRMSLGPMHSICGTDSESNDSEVAIDF